MGDKETLGVANGTLIKDVEEKEEGTKGNIISSNKVGINENTQVVREHKKRKIYGIPRLLINMGRKRKVNVMNVHCFQQQ